MAKSDINKLSLGGVLVSLGIIYGDIGTSPLYVLKAIIGSHVINQELVLGGLSLVFWTLTIQTTLKYVLLTLRADNRGEGGVFSLYALVRRRAKWLIFPAIIGGSALLADGIITPPISVSAAIEGLRIVAPGIPTVPLVIFILLILFSLQQFGTKMVGASFGPVMLIWFSMLAVLGIFQIVETPTVLSALNPYWGFNLLFNTSGGFWLLGSVFLCTTGAEALYSDLGHCGRTNIRVSWIFVKTSLLLNYFGQGAWLIGHSGSVLNNQNPFYAIMPSWWLLPGIIIATMATVIASQALISGSFTLVTEAMRLTLFPKAKVVYPTELKGQIYVPAANLFLLIGCIGIVLYFEESSNMEAAYGLAITLTMLMTTILLSYYLLIHKVPKFLIGLFLIVYLTIEGGFLVANLLKFSHGGWVTLLIGAVLFSIMWVWNQASILKKRYTEYVPLKDYLPVIKDLNEDKGVPKFATHLVYMTGANVSHKIESKIIYSILRKQPKRADVYWFVHVDVIDEPYTLEYKVEKLIPGKVFRVDFRLGFRVEPRINLLFRNVIESLDVNKEIDVLSRYESLRKYDIPGDFRFVVLEKFLSFENALPLYERFIMQGYFLLKNFSLSEEKGFGLDTSSVVLEKVPLVIAPVRQFKLKRIHGRDVEVSLVNGGIAGD